MSDLEKQKHTIESQGQVFAGKLKQRMRLGEKDIHPYIHIKFKDLLKLPRLTSGALKDLNRERFEEDVRFNPITGAIFTTRWQELKTSEDSETGMRSIKHPENYTCISSWYKLPYPDDLPEGGKAIGLVVGRVWDGLELAIRQQYHVLEKYNQVDLEAEPQRLRKIFYWIDRTSQKFGRNQIDKDQLEDLSQEGTELIKKAGLTTAVDSTKQRLAVMLAKATKPDSLGRINPMISRIRLRSALLAATKRIVIDEFSRRKFSSNLEVLVAEREFTRYSLEQAADELSEVQQELWQPNHNIQELAFRVSEIAKKYLAFPRVAPYLISSRLSAIFLVGCREEKLELNRQILGEGINGVLLRKSAAFHLKEGNIYESGKRITWAKAVLQQSLEETRDILKQTDVKDVNSPGV